MQLQFLMISGRETSNRKLSMKYNTTQHSQQTANREVQHGIHGAMNQ